VKPAILNRHSAAARVEAELPFLVRRALLAWGRETSRRQKDRPDAVFPTHRSRTISQASANPVRALSLAVTGVAKPDEADQHHRPSRQLGHGRAEHQDLAGDIAAGDQEGQRQRRVAVGSIVGQSFRKVGAYVGGECAVDRVVGEVGA
jgi:hypothetical protein